MAHGLRENLTFIFSPSKPRGTGMLDRAVGMLYLDAHDMWQARPDVPKEKQALDLLKGLSDKLGITPPKLIICDSKHPNAGSLLNGHMLVTQDALNLFTPNQLEAVLGHELSHHRRRLRDSSVIVGIITLFTAAYAGMARPFVMRQAMKSEGAGLAFAAVEDIAIGVGGLAVTTPYRRSMENDADRDAAVMTQPKDMADALLALQKRSHQVDEREKRQEGFGAQVARVLQRPLSVLDAHPPIESRVERLMAMEEQKHENAASLSR